MTKTIIKILVCIAPAVAFAGPLTEGSNAARTAAIEIFRGASNRAELARAFGLTAEAGRNQTAFLRELEAAARSARIEIATVGDISRFIQTRRLATGVTADQRVLLQLADTRLTRTGAARADGLTVRGAVVSTTGSNVISSAVRGIVISVQSLLEKSGNLARRFTELADADRNGRITAQEGQVCIRNGACAEALTVDSEAGRLARAARTEQEAGMVARAEEDARAALAEVGRSCELPL